MLRVRKVEEDNERINKINYAPETVKLSNLNINFNRMKALKVSVDADKLILSVNANNTLLSHLHQLLKG